MINFQLFPKLLNILKSTITNNDYRAILKELFGELLLFMNLPKIISTKDLASEDANTSLIKDFMEGEQYLSEISNLIFNQFIK